MIEIKSCWTGEVIISGKYSSVKECLEKNRDKSLNRANLNGANLIEANLIGASLIEADLNGANLYRANLNGANLIGASLIEANLNGANLNRASLNGANLYRADLIGANLYGANLNGANLNRASLNGTNLNDIKNYYLSRDIAIEIIRRQPLKAFTDKEWSIIGQITLHRPCWEKIKKDYGKKIISILKKLTKLGFKEYEEHYKTI